MAFPTWLIVTAIAGILLGVALIVCIGWMLAGYFGSKSNQPMDNDSDAL